jgi:hypothetical protein
VTRTRFVTAILLAALSATSLSACIGSQTMPVPSYTSSYKAPDPTGLAPLRGTTVSAGSLANPSLAAKVDNHEEARPQYGLQFADIVFEELVEGGLTRYVAIWQSNIPVQIGPVRSIRPMDPDIISPFGGIVAYSGLGPLREHLAAFLAAGSNACGLEGWQKCDRLRTPSKAYPARPNAISLHHGV